MAVLAGCPRSLEQWQLVGGEANHFYQAVVQLLAALAEPGSKIKTALEALLTTRFLPNGVPEDDDAL